MSKIKTRHIAKNLKHQIIFLENSGQNELDPEKWNQKLVTFAEIKYIYDNSARQLEGISFGHVITEEFAVFSIRFTPEIHSKMRILFKNRHFEIKRIVNINEMNRITQIIALEIKQI